MLKILFTGFYFKTTAPLQITALMSVMTTVSAASCKTHLNAIMISHGQGDGTFVAFQPMGIFHFWRNREFIFFPKMSGADLKFCLVL